MNKQGKSQGSIMLRGIYILPSLFTAANLVLGFLAIIYSIDGQFTPAAWSIVIAIAMDMIDGRVARWTKTTSSFGIEFDSMADLVSFGVAPSVMMYQMILRTMDKPGIAIALFFVLAGAMRLARYNCKAHEGEGSSEFVGLPIPAAAGMLASFVLSYELFEIGPMITVKTIPMIMNKMPFFFKTIPIAMVLMSFLMLSTVPYSAAKKFKANRPKSLQLFSFIIIGLLLIVAYPQNTIFIMFLFYLISGITSYLWRYWRMRKFLMLSFKLKRSGKNESPLDK